jgi:hypothetical protein
LVKSQRFGAEDRWKRAYLRACLILTALVALFNFSHPYSLFADTWEHAAAVRAVAENFLHPSNPLLALPGSTSPRFTPYTLLWGAVMKMTGLSVFTVMGMAALANFLLLASGLYRFVLRQFRREALPMYALFTMLWVWGAGYAWANAYQLEQLLVTLSYAGLFTFAVSFHALASLRFFCDTGRWRHLTAYAILSALAFVTHPITALFCFASALAMLLAEGGIARALLLQAVPLLALAAALAWPYFNYWDVLTKGSSESWFQTPLFSDPWRATGTSVIGYPLILYYALKRRHLFLLYGLLLCVFGYAFSRVEGILIGGRFLFFLMVFLHLAIAVYLEEQGFLSWKALRDSLRGNGLSMVLIFLLVVPPGLSRVRGLSAQFRRVLDPPARPYFFIENRLASTDVVMAEPDDGQILPAITGARVVAQAKGDPLIQTEIERRKADARRFFADGTSLEDRRQLLRRYHATHVLIHRPQAGAPRPSVFMDMDRLGRREAETRALALYRISAGPASFASPPRRR